MNPLSYPDLIDAAAAPWLPLKTQAQVVGWHRTVGALLQAPGWENAFAHWRLVPPTDSGTAFDERLSWPHPSRSHWEMCQELDWNNGGFDAPRAVGHPDHASDDRVFAAFCAVWNDPAWAWMGTAQGVSAQQGWERALAWRQGQALPALPSSPVEFSGVLTPHDLEERLRALVGDRGMSRSFHELGLVYHDFPTSWRQKSPNDPEWGFVLAHTQRSIVGIAGLLERKESVALCYVTTAPAFRQHGRALALVDVGLAYAQAQKKGWVRTRGGKMTEAIPAITAAFDRQVLAARVPHAYSDSRLAALLETDQSGAPRDLWEGPIKALCDEELIAKRALEAVHGRNVMSSFEQDDALANRWQALWAAYEHRAALEEALPTPTVAAGRPRI